MKLFNISFFYFLVFLQYSCSTEQEVGDTIKPNAGQEVEDTIGSTEFSLQKVLQDIFSEQQLVGMSVIIFDDNQLTYQGYFGTANVNKDIQTNVNTSYRVASISKSVTAAAALLLVDNGLVNLDEDINNYLNFSVRNPYHPDNPITLRMLLSHTSSIIDGNAYNQFSSRMVQDNLHIQELIEPTGSFFDTNLFSRKEPGTYFNYSNVTWGIVGTLIEQVSGKNFQAFCKENLFIPLEMEASFDPALLTNTGDLAILYRYNSSWIPQVDDFISSVPIKNNYQAGTNALRFAPQGGLRTSALSLSNFMQMLMNSGLFNGKQILKEETIDLMLSSQWKYEGGNGNTSSELFFSWGLGIHRLTNQSNKDIAISDIEMYGHPGEAYGLISDMYFDPSEKKGIIFITNGKQGSFKIANQSAFYETEEKVFKAIEQFYQSQ